MQSGIQQFLNGVSPQQVSQLVERYDSNGDGKISYEEFLQFILYRNSNTPSKSKGKPFSKPIPHYPPSVDSRSTHDDWADNQSEAASAIGSTVSGYSPRPNYNANKNHNINTNRNKIIHSSSSSHGDDDEVHSEASSALDVSNPAQLEYRLKIFLQNLKSHLVKQATELNRSRSGGERQCITEHSSDPLNILRLSNS